MLVRYKPSYFFLTNFKIINCICTTRNIQITRKTKLLKTNYSHINSL